MKGRLLVAGQFLLLIALAFSPVGHLQIGPLRIIGILLFLLALLVLRKSFRDLGDALTPLPESKAGAELVTTGIYGRVRHPIYSALFLLGTSLALWKQSAAALSQTLLLVILLSYKARYEDSLLRSKFPEAQEYQEEVPAFIPRPRG